MQEVNNTSALEEQLYYIGECKKFLEKKKEKEAAKEAAQWAGGSGQPLARNMVLITETKKRLRWLIRTYA